MAQLCRAMLTVVQIEASFRPKLALHLLSNVVCLCAGLNSPAGSTELPGAFSHDCQLSPSLGRARNLQQACGQRGQHNH